MKNGDKIVVGSQERILRERMPEVAKPTSEIRALVKKMRRIMERADGIGLAANQIGVPLRLFVAKVDNKFYAILNPEIVKGSKEKSLLEEGCLSLPTIFGPVERQDKVTLRGLDPYGRKLLIRAKGLLARVFQHEVDHLNGILFIDKAKEIYRYRPDQDDK